MAQGRLELSAKLAALKAVLSGELPSIDGLDLLPGSHGLAETAGFVPHGLDYMLETSLLSPLCTGSHEVLSMGPMLSNFTQDFSKASDTSVFPLWKSQVISPLLSHPKGEWLAADAAPEVLATRPTSPNGAAVPDFLPMKVALPPEAQPLPTLLDPSIPVKKRPNFAQEFDYATTPKLNPLLPAKKLPPGVALYGGGKVMEAGARVVAAR